MAAVVERKLTTIFSADVAGYSRLMGENEPATLVTLKANRAAMNGLITANSGRIVNTAGDSVLAEFGSVVKAVECAIAIQREVAERNAGLPDDRRMWFRIGINLGDVMVSNGDLFGDGVNVASRLQGLADPGGILVSGQVHGLVKDKVTVGFDNLGSRAVKNIAADISIYRVQLQPPSGMQSAHAIKNRPSSREGETFRHYLLVSGIKTALLVGVVFMVNLLSWDGEWWFQWLALVIVAIFGWRAISQYQKSKAAHLS